MAKVTLPHAVGLGVNGKRFDLKGGEQEVSAEIEKALIDVGIIEAPKKVVKKPETKESE